MKIDVCHPRSTKHLLVLPPKIISTSFTTGHNPASGEILQICCHGMFPPIPFNCMVSWHWLHILWLRYIHLLPENTCFILSAWLIVRFVFLCTKMLRFENKRLESWVNFLPHFILLGRQRSQQYSSDSEGWASISFVSLEHSKQLQIRAVNPSCSVDKSWFQLFVSVVHGV